MEKLFIPFELANIARIKFFNDPCIATYVVSTEILQISPVTNMVGDPCNGLDYKWKNSEIHESCLTAPLYQQIIDWFRDNHKISITPWRELDTKSKWYFEILDERVNCANKSFVDGLSDTYYEALNKAIKESFKLI